MSHLCCLKFQCKTSLHPAVLTPLSLLPGLYFDFAAVTLQKSFYGAALFSKNVIKPWVYGAFMPVNKLPCFVMLSISELV